MIHYHGTPITPRSLLHTLSGKHFCVSFSTPTDVKVCHQIGQSVMLDNGAFSVWRRGISINWADWALWAEQWTEAPTTWAVLPDSIEGDEDENDDLLRQWAGVLGDKGVPVWHLHESLDRLERLVFGFGRVCFGSSGAYAVIGTDSWHHRVIEGFNVLSDQRGRVPWVHMLRGMSLSGDIYPFASVDSTDVARNHNRPQNTPLALAARWDSMQCPTRWTRVEQPSLFEEVT